MRKHDQHNRSVTKTLSETAQAVKLCGKERELGDQRLMGLGSCCDVEVKKRRWREVGATARIFELPPTILITVCLCLMVVIGGATTGSKWRGKGEDYSV